MARESHIRKLAGFLLEKTPQDNLYADASEKVMYGVGSAIDRLFKELQVANAEENKIFKSDRRYQFPKQQHIHSKLQTLLPEAIRAWSNLEPPKACKELHTAYAQLLQSYQDYAAVDRILLDSLMELAANNTEENRRKADLNTQRLQKSHKVMWQRRAEYNQRLQEFGAATKLVLTYQREVENR